MAFNVIKPNGPTQASQPDAGGAVLKQVPLFGVVKDNIDTVRSGRLRVYISDMGGSDPDDSNTWVTVNYMSPFFGATPGSGEKTGYGSYVQNASSYGMWNSPPDLGSKVICIFINGDPNYGYWIGCVPEPETLFMVPAIGASETVVLNEGESGAYGGATRLPVTNINANNDKIDQSVDFWDQPKPVHSYLASILFQQGLLRDSVRGAIGTSSQRESPSRVGWGVSTPGRPIYEGGFDDASIADNLSKDKSSQLKIISRRAGHTFVMDDGDITGKDQLVRIRTSLGHQILLSDNGQTLFIMHANGQSYVELGKEGTIDMYATNSVNVRTQGDLNLHADNNININAMKDLNIAAKNININSEEALGIRTGADIAIQSLGKFGLNATGATTIKSSGEVGIAAGAAAFINGSKVNLNTGSAGFVPGEVKPIGIIAHTDTLFDSTKGWAAAPGKLLSVVSRAPAHSPWASAGQGVDVKINNDASANLPSAPAPAVKQANTAAPAAPSAPVTAAAAATVPPVKAASASLDKNVTATMVSQVATMAQTGPAAAAIASGSGIVGTGAAAQAVIGKTGQTPKQMESAGVIKPGSASLVDSLISKGKTLAQALTANLFTGKPGASNIQAYSKNQPAQVNTLVSNIQQSQKALTQAGLMTGKESPTQIAGLITAGVVSGVKNTVNFVSSAAKSVGSLFASNKSGTTNPLGSVQNSITSGNFAANLATNVTGGLKSLASSVSGLAKSSVAGAAGLLDSAKGIAGNAFAAVTSSFPKLEAGKPQNLKQLADKAVASAQSAGSSVASAAKSAFSSITNAGLPSASIASGASSSATNGGSQVTAASLTPSQLKWLGSADINDPIILARMPAPLPGETGGNVAEQAVQVAGATKTATSPSVLASGLGGLPGSSNAVSAVVSKVKGLVPGTASLSATAKQMTESISTGSLGGVANNILGQLKTPGSSLQKIASAGLSPSAFAALNASIAALSSGGPNSVKMPVVAQNTTDRTAVNAQVNNVLGNPKIPAPNYSVEEAEAALAKIEERKKQRSAILAQVEEQKKIVQEIGVEYQAAIDNFPEGDPEIVKQRERYYAEKKKWAELLNQLTQA